MSGSSYGSYWRQETRLVLREADWDQRMKDLKNQIRFERRGTENMRMKSDNFWVGRTCPISRIINSFLLLLHSINPDRIVYLFEKTLFLKNIPFLGPDLKSPGPPIFSEDAFL